MRGHAVTAATKGERSANGCVAGIETCKGEFGHRARHTSPLASSGNVRQAGFILWVFPRDLAGWFWNGRQLPLTRSRRAIRRIGTGLGARHHRRRGRRGSSLERARRNPHRLPSPGAVTGHNLLLPLPGEAGQDQHRSGIEGVSGFVPPRRRRCLPSASAQAKA